MSTPSPLPVPGSERSEILDVLRGIALLGICLANYPVISLYIFQPPEKLMSFPTAGIDRWLGYFHFTFIDGKFYSLFSLLFGIGFTIILSRIKAAGRNPLPIFYRRLFVLACIGLMHALLLWEGDILLLYALLGMLLPFFRNTKDRTLLVLTMILIMLPILIDIVKVLSDNRINAGSYFRQEAIARDTAAGITEQNAGVWLIEHDTYRDLLTWCSNSFFWRWQMLLEGNRLPKVFGLFLLGMYVGRHLIYQRLRENEGLLRRTRNISLLIGLPFSLAHAWCEFDDWRLPDVKGLTDTVAYALSVVPMSLFYASSISLLYLNRRGKRILSIFAPVGRMALTNYLIQTLIGILIFYGIGLGFGARTGVSSVSLIVIGVYSVQVAYSTMWFKFFRYGPVEWIWKQLTYGKRLHLVREIPL